MGETTLEVLVVEGDAETRTLLVDVLSGEGLEPRACGTGEEALELLRGHHFDAMITDEVVPGITGTELVHRARRLDATLHCVVLSGYPQPSDTDVAWLRKPFSLGALLGALSRPA